MVSRLFEVGEGAKGVVVDLIGSLVSQLGVDEHKAKALAGGVMGLVTNSVKEEAGEDEAAALKAAVPEMGGWQEQARAALGGGGGGGLLGGLLGGGGGGLIGSLAGAVGGQKAQDTVAIIQILERFDVDTSKAALVAPLILDFLKDKLSPELLGTVLKAAPMLGGGEEAEGQSGGGLGGAISGALGGLFGRE